MLPFCDECADDDEACETCQLDDDAVMFEKIQKRRPDVL